MKSFIKKTIALVLLLSGQFFVHGAEPVTGMFGVNLGDTLDSASAANRNVVTGGAVKYEVKPSSPHKSFQTYEVEVTTGTKKIHTITGTGRYPGKEAAMQVFNTVKAELEAKFGPAKTNRREGAAFFNAGQRSVSLLVNETRAAVAFLVLTCKDEDLTPMAEKDAAPVPAPTAVPASTPTPAVAAGGEIEGAFGFKFGEVFNPAKASNTLKDSGGEIFYEVKAPTPHSYFDRYFVSITPKTKKITRVWVQGPVANATEGQSRKLGLVQALESKYGLKRSAFDSVSTTILAQKSKSISVQIKKTRDGMNVLELRYSDFSLVDEGMKEAAEVPASRPDSKGL